MTTWGTAHTRMQWDEDAEVFRPVFAGQDIDGLDQEEVYVLSYNRARDEWTAYESSMTVPPEQMAKYGGTAAVRLIDSLDVDIKLYGVQVVKPLDAARSA